MGFLMQIGVRRCCDDDDRWSRARARVTGQFFDEPVGIQIMIPLYDRGHEARARESAAEAASARFQAEDQRNQFLEGRARLQHSLAELEASAQVSQDSQDLADEQLKATMIQLNSAPDTTNPQAPLLNPKDEQTARIDVQQRRLDYLTAKGSLDQSKVNLMRQTRQLDNWLQGTAPAGTGITATATPR